MAQSPVNLTCKRYFYGVNSTEPRREYFHFRCRILLGHPVDPVTVVHISYSLLPQENKLTGVAKELQKMIDKYHSAVDELLPAELELMMPDIEKVHLGLVPGHSRYKIR